jgi:hypothetical protein
MAVERLVAMGLGERMSSYRDNSCLYRWLRACHVVVSLGVRAYGDQGHSQPRLRGDSSRSRSYKSGVMKESIDYEAVH